MPRTRPAYPPEFRRQIVELVRAGRSPEELAKEFEPSAQTIRTWANQDRMDTGERPGLTSDEKEELAQLRREVKQLREEKEILPQGHGFLRPGDQPVICYRLIDENTAHHDVSLMARLLGVSRQGYYAWRDRVPSRRRREDAELTEKIRGHHERSHGTYGAPRIHADLREIDGLSVGRKRVARLMRKAGLTGVHRRTGRASLTRQDRQATAAPDLIGRDFTASAPNLRWSADIAYVPTDQGWLYLAVVLDLFSRRIVGWAMADHMRTELVTDALAMAVTARRPCPGLVHHSDKGSQYTSLTFGQRCDEAGIRPSTGRTGSCYDNAVTESFFASLETELIDRTAFPTRHHAEQALFAYIEGFYNPRRRHSANGQLSPAEYERRHAAKTPHRALYAAA
ncbi:IS3 family transposase [Streptomyces sp. NBC_01635]|uniref:IS3 family transposase n=1 Tax=Streptomyces sp. NBC_01635 TaxID=2975904 RepID=UPI0038644B32